MSFDYVSIEDAISAEGLRMMVVPKVPSPWGEAAKGIFHVKKLPFKAVRLVYDSEPLKAWARQLSGPVVVFEKERPRSGWAEILHLAERLAPEPALLPAEPEARALALGLSHELLGEDGLAWSRRLQAMDLGLRGEPGGFATQSSVYLAKKYGHDEARAARAELRVPALLGMLSDRLKHQKAAGSAYYLGDQLTAVDIYSAAVMALFAPLPPEQCDMRASTRLAFETLNGTTKEAFDPILLEHRDHVYAAHLELPLKL